MGISRRHLLAVEGLVSNCRVVAESQSHVWTHKADIGFAPCCVTSLNGRSFHHLAYKLHNLGAALNANAERVQPIRVIRVISCQDGSVKVFPALLPVVNNRPNGRLILAGSNLDHRSLLWCRWPALGMREASYNQ